MNDKIKALVQGRGRCVLATVSENRPHTSLMAYLPAEDCRHIYLLSSRSTKKYNNILRNSQVSLLMDTRSDQGETDEVMALTVTGTSIPMADGPDKERIKQNFVKRHPSMQHLAEHPDSDVLAVEVKSYLLLEGVMESYYEEID